MPWDPPHPTPSPRVLYLLWPPPSLPALQPNGTLIIGQIKSRPRRSSLYLRQPHFAPRHRAPFTWTFHGGLFTWSDPDEHKQSCLLFKKAEKKKKKIQKTKTSHKRHRALHQYLRAESREAQTRKSICEMLRSMRCLRRPVLFRRRSWQLKIIYKGTEE